MLPDIHNHYSCWIALYSWNRKNLQQKKNNLVNTDRKKEIFLFYSYLLSSARREDLCEIIGANEGKGIAFLEALALLIL